MTTTLCGTGGGGGGWRRFDVCLERDVSRASIPAMMEDASVPPAVLVGSGGGFGWFDSSYAPSSPPRPPSSPPSPSAPLDSLASLDSRGALISSCK